MSETVRTERAEALRRFKPYPTYKDSGVEWLGEIPVHWELRNARRVVTGIEQGWSPVAEEREAGPNEWAVIKLSAVAKGLFKSTEHKALPVGLSPDTRYEIRDGDFLLTRANTPELVGDVCVVRQPSPRLMLCDLVYRLHLRSGCMVPQFLAYWFLSPSGRYQIQADARGSSQSMVKVSQGLIRAWNVVLPPAVEQRAIATFLDRETARIDALVAKKERLIELLQEKRTALITRAVTKGLDPGVPMKYSGVEWPGEIPTHWDVVRLGKLAAIGNGSTPARDDARYWLDGSYPWLTSAKINEEVIRAADEFVTSTALNECHLPRVSAGSVLVAITGEGQTRGRAALLEIDSTISQHLAYATSGKSRLQAEYLRRVLQSRYEWLRFESSGAGSTRAALTCEFLKTIQVALPPPHEQKTIAVFLDRETDRIDALVARVSDAIELLNEVRTALISAAVTGKIDVREEVE